MKILWLSGNPSLYSKHKNGYNNGGWIGALETEILKRSNIELAIAFLYDDDTFKVIIDQTTYYPINLYRRKADKIKHNLFYEKFDKIEIERIKMIIDDFKPDIIHVWGTEISFGLIATQTNIPVIIHIQGILNPVYNAMFIPGINKGTFSQNSNKGILKWILNAQTLRFWKHNIKREIKIIQGCRNFLGRTLWDKSITTFLSPQSKYFYCSELLRAPFYLAPKWQPHERTNIVITSVLSSPAYKGIDTVLKCANILKLYSNIDFEWNIFGITECQFMEDLTRLNTEKVNVNVRGIVSAELLVKELLYSDIFVHTSYIDNSPNSVCEAQILGLPVISTNVGGMSSLIEAEKTGILIPANDPFLLASRIAELYNDKKKLFEISKAGRESALKRHCPESIVKQLLSIYGQLITT